MKKILILGALISSAAMAAGDVSVSNCLIQEVIPGKQMTGAFFDIENKGKEDVKLTGAAADNKQRAYMGALAYTFLWNELTKGL